MNPKPPHTEPYSNSKAAAHGYMAYASTTTKAMYVKSSKPGYTYFGARYLDSELSLWLSVDPLADMYPSLSPYMYAIGNPVMWIDPDGRSTSPIYDLEGDFMGTDDQGLQGDAIIMSKSDFKQGMSHDDAMKKGSTLKNLDLKLPMVLSDKGKKDITDKVTKKIIDHQSTLSSRPDWDGVVTDAEAEDWWNAGSGGTLYVDISKLNLAPLTTESFDGSEPLQYNFFTSLGSARRTARVHGTLTMRLKNSATGEVGLFQDNDGFFDTYDFNSDGRVIRDITTWAARLIVGEGVGFGFKPYGNNPKVPIQK